MPVKLLSEFTYVGMYFSALCVLRMALSTYVAIVELRSKILDPECAGPSDILSKSVAVGYWLMKTDMGSTILFSYSGYTKVALCSGKLYKGIPIVPMHY